jgi:hypothetical protein
MAEPTAAELATIVANIAKTVETLTAKVDAIQQVSLAAAASSANKGTGSGEHHNDRPPRFQKMDFPKYDGKSDPLAFINRCESYFHQQRIAEEEKVWMASYNLEDAAQMWYIMVERS